MFRNSTVVIKFRQSDRIWLLNCFEGCQHVLARKNIKIAQIEKIMVMRDDPSNTNGLLGLLSTISLSTMSRKIDICGPKSLYKYIFLGRKYSQTNFRHNLYFYNILDTTMIRRMNLYLHSFVNTSSISVINHNTSIFIDFEHSGIFNCTNAKSYNVPLGFLYSHLKQGRSFILPDGFIIYGAHFIYGYYLGREVALLNCIVKKRDIDVVSKAVYTIYD